MLEKAEKLVKFEKNIQYFNGDKKDKRNKEKKWIN